MDNCEPQNQNLENETYVNNFESTEAQDNIVPNNTETTETETATPVNNNFTPSPVNEQQTIEPITNNSEEINEEAPVEPKEDTITDINEIHNNDNNAAEEAKDDYANQDEIIPEECPTEEYRTPEEAKYGGAKIGAASILLTTSKVAMIKPIINDSIDSLKNVYGCTNNHTNHIVYIFKLLNENAFKKVNNTLALSKKFVQYFKEVTSVYQKFSMDIAKSNTILASCTQDTILSENINIMIEKTQEAIAGKFISFSNILFTNIVNKGPFVKVKELETRLTRISKEIQQSIQKVEQKRDNISKRFGKYMTPVFESVKKFYNDDSHLLPILEKHEFYLMEVEVMNSVSKMYNRIFDFLKVYKSNMGHLRTLILEFMVVIKDSVELYINENKKIFSDTTYANFEYMKKFYDSLTEEHLKNTFNLDNILSEKNIKDYFNDTLKALQSTLLKFKSLREITNEDLLVKDELFDISKFSSIEEFVDFIMGFMPRSLDIADKDAERSPLLEFQGQVRRDPGMFSSWKSSSLCITVQETILLFDQKITKKPDARFKIRKLKMKIVPEKKTPFKFELSERKKVMFFNTSSNCSIDALSQESLGEISDLVSRCQKN
jgi:hypothetical protein